MPLSGFLTHIFTKQNKLHLDEILKRNTQLEIITEIAKSITVEMSFEEMMDSITKKLYKVISYDLLSFFLIEGDKLIIRTGVPKDVPVLGIGTVLHSHSAMTWKVVRDKTPLIRHDLENDKQIYDEDKDLLSLDINSVVIVPLLIKNKVIGTLNLGSRQRSAYGETDVIFLQKVADQLALCIENSRLYAEERRLKREWEKAYQNANFLAEEMAKRNLQLEIINQLACSITVETSFDEILENMSFSLKKVISYDLLSFSLLEEKGLVIKKGISKEPSILGEGTVLHPANSAPAKVMQEKRAIIRRDIPNEKMPFHEDPELKLLNINSSVIVPLIVKQKVIGTLNLASEQKNAYSEEDASFLQQVADHLAMCIENARLYAEESRIKRSWEETFKAVTDMLIVIDQKCEIVRYNAAASQLKNENPSSQRLASQPIKELNKASGYSLKENGEQKDKKEEDKEILKICFLSKYWNCSLCPAKKTFSIRRPVGQRFCLESGKTLDAAAYPIFNEKGEVNEVEEMQVRFSEESLELLMSYHWPGNVRELINVISQALALRDGPVVLPHHLPARLRTKEASVLDVTPVSLEDSGTLKLLFEELLRHFGESWRPEKGCDLPALLEESRTFQNNLARAAIERILSFTKGDRSAACKLLNISPRQLKYYLTEK